MPDNTDNTTEEPPTNPSRALGDDDVDVTVSVDSLLSQEAHEHLHDEYLEHGDPEAGYDAYLLNHANTEYTVYADGAPVDGE